MPIHTLLQIRPIVLAFFERFKINPWNTPKASVGDILEAKKIAWNELEEFLANFPIQTKISDWKRVPLCQLLDHLVCEHFDLIESKLPGILAELNRLGDLSGKSPGAEYLSSEWPNFSLGLLHHMREEESFLFPRLLHYDYCLRHRGWHPDFKNGSVNVFVAIHLIGNERRQIEAFHRFIDGWNRSAAHPSSSDEAGTLLHKMTDFNRILVAHNKLETEVLFPMAVALEKASYDAAIAGAIRN